MLVIDDSRDRQESLCNFEFRSLPLVDVPRDENDFLRYFKTSAVISSINPDSCGRLTDKIKSLKLVFQNFHTTKKPALATQRKCTHSPPPRPFTSQTPQ